MHTALRCRAIRRPRALLASAAAVPAAADGPDAPQLDAVKAPPAPAAPISSFHPATTLASLGLLAAIEVYITRVFRAWAVTFPPSLAGMGILFALFCLVNAVSPRTAAALTALVRPGCAWLTRWLAVFFAPSLVALPLTVGSISSADLALLPPVIIGGFLATLLGTATAVALLPEGDAPTNNGGGTQGSTPGPASAPGPEPRRGPLLPALAVVWGLSLTALGIRRLAGDVLLAHSPLIQAHLLSTTWILFAAAERLPRSVRSVLHPTLVAGAGTCAAAAMLGRALFLGAVGVLTPYQALLKAYGCRSWGQGIAGVGAGGILAAILPLTVLGFALQLFDRRAKLAACAPQIATASATGVVTGIFGSAIVARFAGLDRVLARALLPRCLTAPLAIIGASAVGADVTTTVVVVVITGLLGANFGPSILRRLGFRRSMVVGLAVGTSSHGLGTSALTSDPEALAFSAIALAINGLVSASLLVNPWVQRLLALVIG